MSLRQIVTLLMPIVLVAIMVPVFRALARKLGPTGGWYAGLAVYWLLWGLLFPVLLLGKQAMLDLFRPPTAGLPAVLLAAVPVLFAAIGRFLPGMRYEKSARWALLALLGTAVANGVLEELLWRGTSLALFPDNMLLGVLWPSLGFGLWHYAPGSVSSKGRVVGLMVGAALLGLFLSFLVRQTGSLWWAILSHTLAGIVMVL